jgi:ATP-dependent RNA helicase RhlE
MRLMNKPVHGDVTPRVRSVELIEQQVRFVPRSDKRTVLKAILNEPEVGQALVFTRTKRGADVVAKDLKRGGIDAAVIHGNKSQNARQRALAMFREEKARILVATDVAARGLDIDGITHVINFEMPVDIESYVHRIGRTGRAGAAGIAISLCSASERPILRAVEKLIGRKIPVEGPVPDEKDEPVEPSRHPYARRRNGSSPRRNGQSGGRSRRPANSRKSAVSGSPKTTTENPVSVAGGRGASKQATTEGGNKPGRKRRRRRTNRNKTNQVTKSTEKVSVSNSSGS